MKVSRSSWTGPAATVSRDPRTENRPVRVLPAADEDEMTAGHLIATPGIVGLRPEADDTSGNGNSGFGGSYGGSMRGEGRADADADSGSGSISLGRDDSARSLAGDPFSGLGDDER